VFAVCAAALLAGAAAVWVNRAAQRDIPPMDGEFRAAVAAPVEIIRDEWGVPHIRAESEADAHFALGYAMAQDRLFQMELMRRAASGELAALLGPPLVKIDRLARMFLLRDRAEETARRIHAESPEVAAVADAFCAGVNVFQADGPLPFEFAVLGITPRPFTLADSLTVAAILPITFADALRVDVFSSILRESHPDLPVDLLFPGYALEEAPETIMETPEEAAAWVREHPLPLPGRERTGAASQDTARALADALLAVNALWGGALGSNSWVLGPSRTASGKPLLANDPHIGFTNPSIWYEAHLTFGDVDNYGLYLPPIPLALIAHTPRLAWGLTMFCNDDIDLFREQFDPADPGRVMHKGEWTAAKTVPQTIEVRFGPDVRFDVRVTPHGPVVTDFFRFVNGYTGPDISMSWVWQQVPYTDMEALHALNRATTLDEFERGVALVTSPGLNVSCADAEGNIAWWAAGKIVVRPEHVNHKSLLDGASGRDDPLGFLPFAQNPQLKNPPCGFIVTANNLSTVKPVGPLPHLQGNWEPPDRAALIREEIQKREKWDAEGALALQMDDRSYTAPPVLAAVLPVLRERRNTLGRVEAEALELLEAWDLRHNAASPGAAVFAYLCEHIVREALVDELGDEKALDYYAALPECWMFLRYLIARENSPFWDDRGTAAVETRGDILHRAFRAAVSALERRLGESPREWKWGDVHTMTFRHPFGYLPVLGAPFNIGPFPASGARHTINNMAGLGTRGNHEVIGGPSTRRVVDFSGEGVPDVRLVLPTGNSGHWKSPHYDDQAPLFMAGETRRARFTREEVEAGRRHTLRLLPE